MSPAPTVESLRAALAGIRDPDGRDLVTSGRIEGIELRGGLVQVALLTDRAEAARMEPVRREVERVLAAQPGVTNATAVLTAHKPPAAGQGAAQAPGHGPAHG
ncbi:MAG: iron-sulfur cluster assembly protein, partial [Acetobacteraceae bacterium]